MTCNTSCFNFFHIVCFVSNLSEQVWNFSWNLKSKTSFSAPYMTVTVEFNSQHFPRLLFRNFFRPCQRSLCCIDGLFLLFFSVILHWSASIKYLSVLLRSYSHISRTKPLFIYHSGEMAVAAMNHVSHTVSERALARGDIFPFSLPNVEYGVSLLSILYQWRSIRRHGMLSTRLLNLIYIRHVNFFNIDIN